MSRHTDVVLFGVLLVVFAVYLALADYGRTVSQLFAAAGLVVGLFGLAERLFSGTTVDDDR